MSVAFLSTVVAYPPVLPTMNVNPRTCLIAAVFSFAMPLQQGIAEDADFFERRIRPVLVKHCYECHSQSSDIVQAGLVLDFPSEMRQGGDSGPAVVPGKPSESLLVSALKYDEFEMPPSGPLDESVIRDFEKWIRDGAVDPRQDSNESAAHRVQAKAESFDWPKERMFWSFQPPIVSKYSIDELVDQRLQSSGIKPNPPESRRVLARRLSLDLTGMVPEPELVRQFVEDTRPDATQRLVDRLLAMPAFGERWARMWLDLARYAEDQAHKVGSNDSLTYPNAYRYRDWVINALASDMPYDDFIRAQLAADVYSPDDPDSHLALGFLGLGPKYYRRNSPEVMADEWEDRVDVVTRGLLGLTVACARCHDHKYDPIETKDYYALAGVFASTKMYNRPVDETVKTKKGEALKPSDAVHLVREGDVTDLHVMLRGDVNRRGELAPKAFLKILSPPDQAVRFERGSGRADLAEAIVDHTNPLTSRVIVNRIWRQLMGRGFVETPSNFGELGGRPSHPELLDTLATRLTKQEWSLKALIREIVLSKTYQRKSGLSKRAVELDPGNELYSGMTRKPLGIEAYRDSVLAVSGRLDSKIGGVSIQPDTPDSMRKTLYSEISRMDLNPMLARFGFPDPNVHSAKRDEIVTPLQKLFLLNSPFMIRQASSLVDQMLLASDTPRGRISMIYDRLFARSPTPSELDWGLEFNASADRERWNQYAQMLLVSNEMLFVD